MTTTVGWVLAAVVVLILASFPWSHPWLEGILVLVLLGMFLSQWDTISANWKGAFA